MGGGPAAEAGLTPAPPGVASCGAHPPGRGPRFPPPSSAGGGPAPAPRQMQVQVQSEKARCRLRGERRDAPLACTVTTPSRRTAAPICFCNCCPDGPRCYLGKRPSGTYVLRPCAFWWHLAFLNALGHHGQVGVPRRTASPAPASVGRDALAAGRRSPRSPTPGSGGFPSGTE